MQHLDEGTIHAWLDEALDAEESARVARHVEACARCAAAIAEARGFIAGASRILTALDRTPAGVIPGGSPPPSGESGAARSDRGRTIVGRILRFTPTRMAAAAGMIVAVGSLLVWQRMAHQLERPSMLVQGPAAAGDKSLNKSLDSLLPAPAPAPAPRLAAPAVVSAKARRVAEGEPKAAGIAGGVPASQPAPIASRAPGDRVQSTALRDIDAPVAKRSEAKIDTVGRALAASALEMRAVPARAAAADSPVASYSRNAAIARAPEAARERQLEQGATNVPAGCYVVEPDVPGVPSRLSLDSTGMAGAGALVGGVVRTPARPAAPALREVQEAPRRPVSQIRSDGTRAPLGGAYWTVAASGDIRITIGGNTMAVLDLRRDGELLRGVARTVARVDTVTVQRTDCRP